MVTKRFAAAMIAFSLLQLSSYALAQDDREPTPEEEKELAVKLAKMLEDDPLGEHAKEARRWFTMWVIRVPDITVKVCGSFLGPVFEKNKKYSSELVTQMMYSQAAFIIENPDKAEDDFAVYRAGLLASLRAYESILRAKPKVRIKYLDELIEKRGNCEIDAYVRLKMQDCN